jgi:hypothetical protein
MPPWSKDSWPQWIAPLREAMWPVSVSGVRPAQSITGTLSRAMFISMLMVLPVPTVTWTITAAGLPAMR